MEQLYPFQVLFSFMETLWGKLPTNAKIIFYGQEPISCYCYYIPGQDNIEYIFVVEHFARNVWAFFADYLGLDKSYTPFRNLVMRWGPLKAKTIFPRSSSNLLLSLLPTIITL